MPDYRETLIRIDHASKLAEIWTTDRSFKAKLTKIHAKPMNKQSLGEWFELPADRIRLISRKRTVDPETSVRLQAILAKARQSKATRKSE